MTMKLAPASNAQLEHMVPMASIAIPVATSPPNTATTPVALVAQIVRLDTCKTTVTRVASLVALERILLKENASVVPPTHTLPRLPDLALTVNRGILRTPVNRRVFHVRLGWEVEGVDHVHSTLR